MLNQWGESPRQRSRASFQPTALTSSIVSIGRTAGMGDVATPERLGRHLRRARQLVRSRLPAASFDDSRWFATASGSYRQLTPELIPLGCGNCPPRNNQSGLPTEGMPPSMNEAANCGGAVEEGTIPGVARLLILELGSGCPKPGIARFIVIAGDAIASVRLGAVQGRIGPFEQAFHSPSAADARPMLTVKGIRRSISSPAARREPPLLGCRCAASQ